MNLEVIQAVLPWLALLACPLMMLWCMRGMTGGSCGRNEQPGADTQSPGGAVVRASLEEEIGMLRTRLAALEARKSEQEELR